MSFSVNNVTTMTNNLNLNNNNKALDNSLNSLSSGNKLLNAASDASSLSIANQLSAQVSGMGQSIMNKNDSIGMIQIADGATQGVGENLDKIRALTLRASNASMSDESRAAIQKEIDGLMRSSGQIISSASYNGTKLFSPELDSQSFEISAEDIKALSIEVDVTTEGNTSATLDVIDSARKASQNIRVELGSSQNKLLSEIESTAVTQINTASAESQLRDVDFALESSNFSQSNMMSEIGSFVQAQSSNTVAANIGRLFQ